MCVHQKGVVKAGVAWAEGDGVATRQRQRQHQQQCSEIALLAKHYNMAKVQAHTHTHAQQLA